MKRSLGLFVLLVAVLALGVGAHAASIGDKLPANASEVPVYELKNGNWVQTENARSWNSNPVDSGGYTNQESTGFVFTNHASVAQWIKWTITGTRKDWRVTRPGIYAADSIGFTILSNNDVDVLFEDFEDLQYEEQNVPNGTQDTIETWYSYGETVEEAESNGWVRAEDLNDINLTFVNSEALHYGLAYKLWSKIQVEDSNNSSDYEDVGYVTFVLTNMKHWIDPETGDFREDQFWYPF